MLQLLTIPYRISTVKVTMNFHLFIIELPTVSQTNNVILNL